VKVEGKIPLSLDYFIPSFWMVINPPKKILKTKPLKKVLEKVDEKSG